MIKNKGKNKFMFKQINANSSEIKRRSIILESMSSLDSQKINCHQCTGTCCTFKANSMKITPIEAIDLLNFLESKNRTGPELINLLQDCVKEFRLDYELSIGGSRSFRRTYTCPFFNGEKKGCTIAPQYKPYGCLAFNPFKSNVIDGENCKSNILLLQKREELEINELEINKKIIKELNLNWNKESIPVALLSIIKK